MHSKHIDRKMSDVRSERKPKANDFLHSTIIQSRQQTTSSREQGMWNRERGIVSNQKTADSSQRVAINRQRSENNRRQSTIDNQQKEEAYRDRGVGIGGRRAKIQGQRFAADIRPVGRIRPTVLEKSVLRQSSIPVSQSELLYSAMQQPLKGRSIKTKQSFSRGAFDSVRVQTAASVPNPELSRIVLEPVEAPVTNVFSADAFREEENGDGDIDKVIEIGQNDGLGFDHIASPHSEGAQKAIININEDETVQESTDIDSDEGIYSDAVLSRDAGDVLLEAPGDALAASSEDAFDFLDKPVREAVSTWSTVPRKVTEESRWQDPIVFGPRENTVSSHGSQLSRDSDQPISFPHIQESDTFDQTSLLHERCVEQPSKVFRRHKMRGVYSLVFQSVVQRLRTFLGVFHQIGFSRRAIFAVLSGVLVMIIGIGGWQVVRRGVAMKGEVLGVSAEGYAGLEQAIADVKAQDFSSSEEHFADASISFGEASNLLNSWGTLTIEASRFIPGVSQLASGSYLADAAKNIADAGQLLSRAGSGALLFGPNADGNISFLDAFQNIRGDMADAERLLSVAEDNLDKVKVEDLPDDKRAAFLKLRTELPTALAGMRLLLDHGDIFSDMLGKNGPRRFLFLFQNNHEMRATGGFIGSYAYLDVANGRVRNFFVDGIFNPDGQLKEDIVPPIPIQKVSAGWSLHDSNWFPNFPTSAEKAIFFYEKTGGPTVDGVVAITPDVLKHLLEITGPIRLDQYDVTVDSENFIDLIQYQVEVAYDREENRPKKILSDLAPMLLDRLFGSGSSTSNVGKTLSAIEDALSEKHILFYSRNSDLESLVSRAGWSGEVLPASRDYLGVINTNINGFKTDGVVKESIEHHADIGSDGIVTDTVTITRRHVGGQTGREWWDAVNADYMRVYVPLGSELVSAEGYTRETVVSPLDYDALHFSRDRDVEHEESNMHIDPVSGTRLSEDAGKTVFGNWVYVSPGEEVHVTYTYRLPFRVDPGRVDKAGFDSYSVVFQKQSGSFGSNLFSTVTFPSSWHAVWQSDTHLVPYGESGLRLESDLVTDRFLGVVLSDE